MQVGLSITALGMGIVFAFIALLSLAIHLLSRFQGEIAAEEPSSQEIVAVISAALHAYRSQSKTAERRDRT